MQRPLIHFQTPFLSRWLIPTRSLHGNSWSERRGEQSLPSFTPTSTLLRFESCCPPCTSRFTTNGKGATCFRSLCKSLQQRNATSCSRLKSQNRLVCADASGVHAVATSMHWQHEAVIQVLVPRVAARVHAPFDPAASSTTGEGVVQGCAEPLARGNCKRCNTLP